MVDCLSGKQNIVDPSHSVCVKTVQTEQKQGMQVTESHIITVAMLDHTHDLGRN